MLEFWIKGLILGFSIAAPVGPIGLLCIRRTLNQGQRAGFVSGMGAASADALYGSLAAFGLSAVFTLLTPVQYWLQLGGALFLIWLGWMTVRKPFIYNEDNQVKRAGLIPIYGTTFLLTLSNPATILSFLAIFSGVGLVPSVKVGWQIPVVLVLGVFCGSALWWLLLSSGVYFLKLRVLKDHTALQWINRVSGILLAGFGLISILNLILV
ncbi:MAG: LysE family translocator [Anaerolineaceae bacterium]|nr:LysE family translocator [Anaerolineaceae bacterium]